MAPKTSLERKMLSYFGLIAAASLLITVEFVYAIQSAIPVAQTTTGTSIGHMGASAGPAGALEALRGKAMLMFVVQAIVTLIVLIMFMRRITSPLQHMVDSSSKIMEGDLSRTIDIRSRDEIGLLAETINGLTSNIQELVAFCRSILSSVKDELDCIPTDGPQDPDLKARLRSIEEKLEGLDTIMEEFKLLAPPDSKGAAAEKEQNAS